MMGLQVYNSIDQSRSVRLYVSQGTDAALMKLMPVLWSTAEYKWLLFWWSRQTESWLLVQTKCRMWYTLCLKKWHSL